MIMKFDRINRCLAFLLIAVLNINSFGAIVSDNDGSAFITKNEFETLKSDFNRQIKDYNDSIDGKIDGAISSYLAGVQLAKTREESIYYAPANGVESVTTGNIFWEEGKVRLNFASEVARWNLTTNSSGTISFTAVNNNGDTDTFKDCFISDVWYDSGGSAEWIGVGDNIQNLTLWYKNRREDSHLNLDLAGGNARTNISLGMGYGWGRLSNSTMTSMQGDFWLSPVDPGSSRDNTWTYSFTGDKAEVTREITNLTKTDVILTPSTKVYSRFSNYDNIRDWCNETDEGSKGGHTAFTSFNDYGVTGTCQVDVFEKNTSTGDVFKGFKYLPTYDLTATRKFSGSDSDWSQYYPYIGFVKTITDWNQLYTSRYDDVLDSIFEDPNETRNVKTNKEFGTNIVKTHLSLNAGYPIVTAKKDEIVEWTFKFSDSGTHYIWINEGCFSADKDPKNEPGLITSFESISNATYDSTNKALKVTNTNPVTLRILKKNKRTLFAKWTINPTNLGGGILVSNPTATIIVP